MKIPGYGYTANFCDRFHASHPESADSGPCGQLIPVDVGTESALMWAGITPRCGQDSGLHRNQCPHGVIGAHITGIRRKKIYKTALADGKMPAFALSKKKDEPAPGCVSGICA